MAVPLKEFIKMTVYFDNASTTQVCPEAAELMLRVMREEYGNPSSTHAMGRRGKDILETARKNIASALGAGVNEIFFTSGGTEADNWAVFGAAEAFFRRGRHIITTDIEHDAVTKPIKKLESQGWEITWLKPDQTGRISVAAFAEALREDTSFASVILVNNETGALNPIPEMTREIKRHGLGTVFHTDAVQGFCKVPFTPKALGADLITISAHKIHGPKGAGALYIRDGLKLPPLLLGGGQEKEKRSGTEALPAVAGFGEAARLAKAQMDATTASMRKLYGYTVSMLSEKLPEAVILSPGDAPHILSLSLPGYKSEVLMNYLEAEGIYVSKSSACKKGARSHVLEAMRLPAEVIDGALRVSFSRYSTKEEAEYFADKLADASRKLFKTLK
jgi:cysteine desulfurase